eukprot:5833727-Amphidinium_carterae.1
MKGGYGVPNSVLVFGTLISWHVDDSHAQLPMQFHCRHTKPCETHKKRSNRPQGSMKAIANKDTGHRDCKDLPQSALACLTSLCLLFDRILASSPEVPEEEDLLLVVHAWRHRG